MAFSRFVQKLWREKANKLISSYVLTATSYGADGATFRQKFGWFFQSLTAGYKLPGVVRQLNELVFQPYSLYRAFAVVVFRILSVTCSLTRALSHSLTHAQQLFSASTPGQILAPRVCTLVLFILQELHCLPNCLHICIIRVRCCYHFTKFHCFWCLR